jgi:hypothetical protein
MNQVADFPGLHLRVLEQVIDPRIDRHHRVEHTGMRVGIELHENLRFGHHFIRGCFGLRSLSEGSVTDINRLLAGEKRLMICFEASVLPV